MYVVDERDIVREKKSKRERQTDRQTAEKNRGREKSILKRRDIVRIVQYKPSFTICTDQKIFIRRKTKTIISIHG